MPRRRIRRLLPPPAGRNTRQYSIINNALNNNNRSSPAKKITTAMAAMAAAAATMATVGVAPPTPLLPRVYGRPTSTPGPVPFRCERVSEGRRPAASPTSTGYAGQRSSLQSSTVGQTTLHATTCASTHSPWSAASSSTVGSSGMVPMDGLVGSIVAGQLLQHRVHGPSCKHQLTG
jgi:hypothetical protein